MSYQTVTIVFEFESDTEPIIIRKQYQTFDAAYNMAFAQKHLERCVTYYCTRYSFINETLIITYYDEIESDEVEIQSNDETEAKELPADIEIGRPTVDQAKVCPGYQRALTDIEQWALNISASVDGLCYAKRSSARSKLESSNRVVLWAYCATEQPLSICYITSY